MLVQLVCYTLSVLATQYPSDLPHQPPKMIGYRHSSSSSHILSCSQKHIAFSLNGSQTYFPTSDNTRLSKQYRLTARITLAKLRSLHMAVNQFLQTMSILSHTIAILLHTSVSRLMRLGITLTDLSAGCVFGKLSPAK